jgi:hypothetical protein
VRNWWQDFNAKLAPAKFFKPRTMQMFMPSEKKSYVFYKEVRGLAAFTLAAALWLAR